MTTSTAQRSSTVIDLVRRRQLTTAPEAAATIPAPVQLGTVLRRYGLMSCEEAVVVCETVATSGDLAVADRLAFIASIERRTSLVVIAVESEYHAVIVERPLDSASMSEFSPAPGAPRVMSLVSERGITPALGVLAGAPVADAVEVAHADAG